MKKVIYAIFLSSFFRLCGEQKIERKQTQKEQATKSTGQIIVYGSIYNEGYADVPAAVYRLDK